MYICAHYFLKNFCCVLFSSRVIREAGFKLIWFAFVDRVHCQYRTAHQVNALRMCANCNVNNADCIYIAFAPSVRSAQYAFQVLSFFLKKTYSDLLSPSRLFSLAIPSSTSHSSSALGVVSSYLLFFYVPVPIRLTSRVVQSTPTPFSPRSMHENQSSRPRAASVTALTIG